jgi:hypothetical protein
MEAARKLNECECRAVTDLLCDGCGKTVCTVCSTTEICSFDPKNIQVKHYCHECIRNVAKNPWGELYWKNLVAMFV